MLLIRNKHLRQLAGLLETFNFLSLKLLLKRPGRLRTFPGYQFREYMRAVGEGAWRSRDLFELVQIPPGTRVTLEHMPGGTINAPIDELAYMAIIAKALNPEKIFEIGTFRGRTALNFAINSPENCIVYTLDLPDAQGTADVSGMNTADQKIARASATGADYRGKPEAAKIVQLFGNSLTFDFTPYFGSADLVFVDGAHHFDAVVSDTRNALKLVRPGGVIMWHDWGNYGDYNDVVRGVLDVVPAGQVFQIASTQLALYRRPIGTK
jgi:predicted O-methyltransferase YrrM